jgi:nicotinic acid phosphoribosyltransferase
MSVFLSKKSRDQYEEAFLPFILSNKELLIQIMSNFGPDGTLLPGPDGINNTATFFNDYYKWTMYPVSSRVYDSLLELDKHAIMSFSVDFRDQHVREQLASDSVLQNLIHNNLEIFARRTFNPKIFEELIAKKYAQSLDDSLVPPVSQLTMYTDDVEAICLDNEGNPRTIAHPKICLEKYIPGVTPGYNINDVVIACYIHEGQFFVEDTGPWPLVTWLETSMMQNVYQTIMTYMREKAGMTYDEWLYNAMLRCFKSIQYVIQANLAKPEDRPGFFNGALFAGRRSGSMEFLVIQNWMVKELYKHIQEGKPYLGCIGTSSVDAWWLLKEWGICVGPNEVNPIGTHAHEESMGTAGITQAFFPQLDSVLPLSQVLGHYLYYKYSSIRQDKSMKLPMLSDTSGTKGFLAAGNAIIMPSGKTFLEECIGSARQDSGTLEGFIEFLDEYNLKVPVMASEISTREDILNALLIRSKVDRRSPYIRFGAGGFHGDNPKVFGDNEFYTAMAAKIVRCFIINAETKQIESVTYPVKLGDPVPGKPGKVSIDGTLGTKERDAIIQKANLINEFVSNKTPQEIIEHTKELGLNELFWSVVSQLGL